MSRRIGIALLAAAVCVPEALADDWDVLFFFDNGASTGNVLLHGSEQVHDLRHMFETTPEADAYRVTSRAFSSYQMVVDGQTGELDLASSGLQRLNATGGLVLENALVSDAGRVLSLQWQQGAGAVEHRVRVQGAACGTSCTEADTYRIRFYDTTYTLPHFDSSGGRSTVVRVQNATERGCAVTLHFLAASGALLATSGPTTVPARGVLVRDAAEAVGSGSGSVRVTHTCGYGGLSGKAVTFEPAAGVASDTPLVPRPH
jgi:hypothetical protein